MRPTKLRAVSQKMARRRRNYSTLRLVYLENVPECEAQLPGCTYVATDIHHKRGRGVYTDHPQYFMAVCRSCHEAIELMPAKQAQELGFKICRHTT